MNVGRFVLSTILFIDDHHAFRTVFAEVLLNVWRRPGVAGFVRMWRHGEHAALSEFQKLRAK
jgi:hypothetical protein